MASFWTRAWKGSESTGSITSKKEQNSKAADVEVDGLIDGICNVLSYNKIKTKCLKVKYRGLCEGLPLLGCLRVLNSSQVPDIFSQEKVHEYLHHSRISFFNEPSCKFLIYSPIILFLSCRYAIRTDECNSNSYSQEDWNLKTRFENTTQQ